MEKSEFLLKTNSNYFDSFDGEAKIGLFQIENKSKFKNELDQLKTLSNSLKKIEQQLGDKNLSYKPKGERVWFVLDGYTVNQFHPFYEELGEIVDKIFKAEVRSEKDILALKKSNNRYILKSKKGKKSTEMRFDSSNCETQLSGIKCKLSGSRTFFLPK